jgi:hypothetical protein
MIRLQPNSSQGDLAAQLRVGIAVDLAAADTGTGSGSASGQGGGGELLKRDRGAIEAAQGRERREPAPAGNTRSPSSAESAGQALVDVELGHLG